MAMAKDKYASAYSQQGFFSKVTKYAKAIGQDLLTKAFTLYYCFKDSDTPAWAKATIIGALGYLISPVDAIPDLIPIVGYSDDAGVLVMALAAVGTSIKALHKKQAKQQVKDLFG